MILKGNKAIITKVNFQLDIKAIINPARIFAKFNTTKPYLSPKPISICSTCI